MRRGETERREPDLSENWLWLAGHGDCELRLDQREPSERENWQRHRLQRFGLRWGELPKQRFAGSRHDVLNDTTHREVAAAVIAFIGEQT
jgi:hypothetical protein